MKRVFTDINADYGNRTLCCRSHGMLLISVPLASLSLAEQEHGRTIPLPVLVGIEIPQRSSLPPYIDVLSFWSEAPTAPTSIPDLVACREVIR